MSETDVKFHRWASFSGFRFTEDEVHIVVHGAYRGGLYIDAMVLTPDQARSLRDALETALTEEPLYDRERGELRKGALM